MDECARIMLAEVVKQLKAGSTLETVYFVLFDSAACDVFQLIWQQLQKDLASGAVSA
jgi:O-acetyl-ADP-ribose deacetylase (regulator of RNase III)